MDDEVEVITPLAYKMMPWIAAMAFFMQTLDTSILNTALPAMAGYLNESPLNMQSAIISYSLTLALFIPLSGFLADRFGTRNIFIFSILLFTFGSLLCALSQTLFVLNLARIVQGVGGAMMVPISRLTLLKAFKKSDFLAALNASVIPGMIGPMVGPVLGGYLVEYMSWHWIFLINIPIGILGIVAGIKFMPNIKGTINPFDGIGFILISIGIICTTLALEFINEDADLVALLFFIVGILLIILYFPYAKRAVYPLFPLTLFTIRTFKIGIIGNLISRLGISAIPLLIPLLLQVAFHYSALDAGLLLLPMALASLCMKTFVQRILGSFGYRSVLTVNTMLAGIIIMLLAVITHTTPIIIICLILFGIGMVNSLQFTAMNSITLADLEGDLTSSGNSFMVVNQQLAMSLGIALGSVLVRLFNQSDWQWINGDISQAFRMSFLILGAVTFLSAMIFLKLTSKDGNNLTVNTKRMRAWRKSKMER